MAGLDRIIISLDGLTDGSYTFYRRGGQLEKVVEGIKRLSGIRKQSGKQNPLIEIQFLVNNRNIKEIPLLKSFCKDLGADVLTLKSMQVYGEEGQRNFLPGDNKFNRYSSGSGKKKIKSFTGIKPCFRLWSHAVYTSDGIAVPCCYDKIPEYPIGNADNKKPGELWFSPGMNEFRQKVMDNRKDQAICMNCGG